MGLVSTQKHALSRQMRFFSKTELGGVGWEEPADTDAAKVISATFSPERPRNVRMDSRSTRSAMQRVQAKGSIGWTVEAEVIPSGTAGAPPGLHPLYRACLGTYTNTPATSDAYTPANAQTLATVTMVRHFDGVLQESIWGAWVDEMSLSIQGGETPKVSFSGGAMGYVHTGTSTLNGAMVATNTMVVDTDDQHAFSINSWISVGSNDGVVVTADTSRPSFTIDGSPISADDSDAVVPYAPAEPTTLYTKAPASGLAGSIIYDSDTVAITGMELNIKNNIRPLDDEAFEEFPSDIVPGFREVTGQITMRARQDFIQHLVNRRAYATKAATLTIGGVAGSQLVVSVPYLEVDYAAVDVPAGDGEVIVTLPFVALGSTAGENEVSLTFQ